jgi:hypothetical protein
MHAGLAEARLPDFKTMLEDIQGATGPPAAAGGTAGGTRNHRSTEGTRARTASVRGDDCCERRRVTSYFLACRPYLWRRSDRRFALLRTASRSGSTVELLSFTGARPGMKVLDMGAGGG